jgi:hypothetical protein
MSLVASYANILDARMKKVYSATMSTVEEEYLKIANKVDWAQYQYVLQGVTGLGMGQVIADGQVPASDAPIQGYNKTYTQAIFTQRVRLSAQSYYYLFESKNFAKIDAALKDTVLNLKNAVTHLKNYYSQSMLANGASTSFNFTPIGGFQGSVSVDTTSIDSVAAWSASHTREDGGANWSDIITGNPAFSFANILAARTQHSVKKDGRGLPFMSSLDTLVVRRGSSAHFLATSIKKTIESGKYPSATPGTSGSFVDAAPTDTFEIVALSPYGGSSDSAVGTGINATNWFMNDSNFKKDGYGLQYIESKGLDIGSLKEDYVGNLDLIATATCYCQFGFADMRSWMSSLN